MLSPSKHESAPCISPLKRLPSPKARFPLLDERLHALLLILGSEENLEGLAFKHQPRLERAVLSGKQDLLDLHDGERRHLGDLARHRSEEHTSELQSLLRISYAFFCLKKKKLS